MLSVTEILSEGSDNARTGRELCNALNVNARELTIAIERERRAGAPICANTHNPPGYYLAANKEEMRQYCNRLRHRAGEIHKTRNACINSMRGLPDQEA